MCELFLGITGGSVDSFAVCSDRTGTTLSICRSGPVALHRYAGLDSQENLRSLNEGIAEDLGTNFATFQEAVTKAVFAVAGVNSPYDEYEAKKLLVASGWKTNHVDATEILDYAEAVLIAGNSAAPGVSIVNNVGSAICAAPKSPLRQARSTFKVGGWGPFVGDFASAFDIGFRLLRHRLLSSVDGEDKRSGICRFVSDAAGIESVENLLIWFDSLWDSTGPPDWRLKIAEIGLKTLDHIVNSNHIEYKNELKTLLDIPIKILVKLTHSVIKNKFICDLDSVQFVKVVMSGTTFDICPDLRLWISQRICSLPGCCSQC